MTRSKLLKRNGGGDRTRTCISFRTAVFKTAALPLCDPSDYGAGVMIAYASARLNSGGERRGDTQTRGHGERPDAPTSPCLRVSESSQSCRHH
jgi:hypothetical protein